MLTLRLLLPSRSVISDGSFLGFLSPELSQIGLRPRRGEEPADPGGWTCKFIVVKRDQFVNKEIRRRNKVTDVVQCAAKSSLRLFNGSLSQWGYVIRENSHATNQAQVGKPHKSLGSFF